MSATYEERGYNEGGAKAVDRGYLDRGSSAAERLYETAKRNPEGALLVAAGVCLMMRGVGRKSGYGFWKSSPRASYRPPAGYSSSRAGGSSNLREDDQSRGMMDTVRDTASDMTDRARQSAEEMAGYADHLRRAAADTSGRIIGRTTSTVQSGVERMVDEQPLALAILGLAAGAAVAALVPPTRMEERTLGPIGERITEEAEEAGRRLKDSAAAAGKRLASEGVAEAARSVFSGDHDEKSRSTESGSMGLSGGGTGPKSSAGGMPGSGTAAGGLTGSSASSGGKSGSATSAGGTPSSSTAGTTAGTPGRTYESSVGKSDKEPGSASGPGPSGTGRAS
jgi:hypothetical protein